MLSKEEYNRYKKIIEAALLDKDDIVTDWERKFFTDFQVKFEQYLRNTLVSPEQDRIFDRVERKLEEELGPL